MEMHLPFQTELLVFLAIAAVLVPLFARAGVNTVLGFLLTGILIGPYGLGQWVHAYPWLSHIVFEDIHGVGILAELGVIFLLFSIGLELSLQRLKAMRRMIFGLGSLQVALCTVVIGLTAWAWGNSAPASLVIGSALALSSTAMVMKILMDRQLFASPVGQTSFSILLLQDLAVVPILFMIPLLQAQGGDQPVLYSLLLALAKAGGVIILLLAFGQFVVRPALRFITAGSNGPEFFMAQIALILICASWATGAAGLSMALGAFLAGLVLAETEFRHQIEIEIEPFKGLFLGVFFLSVGMGIDPQVVMNNLLLLGASSIGLFAVKGACILAACRIMRLPLPISVQSAMTLGQAGEFAFVIFGIAMAENVIPVGTAQFMLTLTSLSLALTPLLFRLGDVVSRRMIGNSPKADAMLDSYAHKISDHIVIAGFGRTGQAIADILEKNQIPYVAIESRSDNLDTLRRANKPVFYGDASNSLILEKVNALHAKAIVLTMDDAKSTQKVTENIRAYCPAIKIFARTRDEQQAEILRNAGVSGIVFETHEMSLQLAGKALRCFEYSDSATSRIIGSERGNSQRSS